MLTAPRNGQQNGHYVHPSEYGAAFPQPDARGHATASTAIRHAALASYQPNSRRLQQDPYHGLAVNEDLGVGGRHLPASLSGDRDVRHHASASSHPTSFRRGRVPRGVQITYLPARCTKSDANRLLARYGTIESGSMRVSSNSACATVQAVFKSKQDAEKIVNKLHGSNVEGKVLQVIFDETYENKLRSPSTSADSAGSSEKENVRRPSNEGPVVVDGARGSRYKRPATDSEDESGDSSDEEEEATRRKGGKGGKFSSRSQAMRHRLINVRQSLALQGT